MLPQCMSRPASLLPWQRGKFWISCVCRKENPGCYQWFGIAIEDVTFIVIINKNKTKLIDMEVLSSSISFLCVSFKSYFNFSTLMFSILNIFWVLCSSLLDTFLLFAHSTFFSRSSLSPFLVLPSLSWHWIFEEGNECFHSKHAYHCFRKRTTLWEGQGRNPGVGGDERDCGALQPKVDDVRREESSGLRS